MDVITDLDRQKYIIEMCHAGIQGDDIDDTAKHTGGHLGINKTQDKISSRFYWPNIREDMLHNIARHVKDANELIDAL